jgi:phage baseplate assembly protein gpV
MKKGGQPQQDALPQCGVVTSVDNAANRVKVYLPLLDLETDPIRIGSLYVGAGWGLKSKLHQGNEVLVVFPNGDLNNGIVTNVLFSEGSDAAPSGADFQLVHESGSIFEFDSAGNVTLQAKGMLNLKGSKININ